MASLQEQEITHIYAKLPYTPTHQEQDGCVTANARAIVPHMGIDFDNDFLPALRRYQLDDKNPENNHMLGIAVVGATLGLNVAVHRVPELDILSPQAPASAKEMHPRLIQELSNLAEAGRVRLSGNRLELKDFHRLVTNALLQNQYVIAFLDWERWDSVNQLQFGNPRHVVSVVGLDVNFSRTQDSGLRTQDEST